MFAPHAKIVHIDVDPASISKIINADIPIVGQVKESLLALIKEIKRSKIKIDSEALDNWNIQISQWREQHGFCLLYTSPSPRDGLLSRMPSSA